MNSEARSKNDLKYQLKKYDLLENNIVNSLLILISACINRLHGRVVLFSGKSKIFFSALLKE